MVPYLVSTRGWYNKSNSLTWLVRWISKTNPGCYTHNLFVTCLSWLTEMKNVLYITFDHKPKQGCMTRTSTGQWLEWLAPSPHSKKVSGLIPRTFQVEFTLHVLPLPEKAPFQVLWLPRTDEHIHVRLIGNSKLVHRCEHERRWLWHCVKLATCPGCDPAFTPTQLG